MASMDDKLELITSFPGALSALLRERYVGHTAPDSALVAFVTEVVEDHFFVTDGELHATDGSSYTIVWHPAPRAEWVEWDQVCHERRAR
jgi:hypothetical protein